MMQLHHNALREASRLARARRELSVPTGVASLASLLETLSLDTYNIRSSSRPQVPLIADAVDEPSYHTVVKLLDVLSPEGSEFDSLESNVIDTEGKSLVIS